ncbi:hypothetical protein MPSEU_000069400 [Mayamaea pseudoterrestris]|nr:hypothetical protein MPSEU_000069400 [Mayamaea pseudoterrestris]
MATKTDPRLNQLLKRHCEPKDVKVTLEEMTKRLEDVRFAGFDAPARQKLLESLISEQDDLKLMIFRKTDLAGLSQDFVSALPQMSIKRMTQDQSAPHLARLCKIALIVKASEAKCILKADSDAWRDLYKLALLVENDARDAKLKKLTSAFYDPSKSEQRSEQLLPFNPSECELYPPWSFCYLCQHSNMRQGAENIANHHRSVEKLQTHDIIVKEFERDRAAARAKLGITRMPPKPTLLPITINCYCYRVKCTSQTDGGNCKECSKTPGALIDAETNECQCEVCQCSCNQMIHIDQIDFIREVLLEQLY